MKTTPSSRGFIITAAASLLFIISVVYFNGLQGPFLFDDHPNIIDVPHNAVNELNLSQLRDVAFTSGGSYPDRALARLSFAFNYYFAGGEYNILAFKLTNLGIHLLNAFLLWFIAHRLLARFAQQQGLNEVIAGRPWWQWAALVSAFIWALHPLQLTAVLYIVQRMTSLSTLFCLLGLAVWIFGRERLESGNRGALALMSGGIICGTVLGFFSKENAILLPYYALLTEWVFFRRDKLSTPALNTLRGFFLLFAIVPAVLATGLIVSHWESIALEYESRHFTLLERLMTESRILWFYLQLLIFPDSNALGIFHDDIALSRGLLSPWTTLSSLLGWMAALGLAIVGLSKHRLFSFAILWYLIGHSIESSFIALELVFEHRNYMPVIGVVVVLCVYLLRGLLVISDKPVLHIGIPSAMILVLSGVTFARANIWEHQYTLMYIGVKNHPNSSRFQQGYAAELSSNGALDSKVFEHLQSATRLATGQVNGLFEMSRIINRRLMKAGIPNQPFTGEVNHIDVYNDPIPTKVEALIAYDAAIDKEARRMASEDLLGVIVTDVARIVNICIKTKSPLCERMSSKVTAWIKAIAENPRQFPQMRARSALVYAKAMAASGDIQAAIDGIDLAISLTPKMSYFRIEKARLFLALQELDIAEEVLDEAQEYLHWSGHSRKAIDSLRKQIQEARSFQSQPSSVTIPSS